VKGFFAVCWRVLVFAPRLVDRLFRRSLHRLGWWFDLNNNRAFALWILWWGLFFWTCFSGTPKPIFGNGLAEELATAKIQKTIYYQDVYDVTYKPEAKIATAPTVAEKQSAFQRRFPFLFHKHGWFPFFATIFLFLPILVYTAIAFREEILDAFHEAWWKIREKGGSEAKTIPTSKTGTPETAAPEVTPPKRVDKQRGGWPSFKQLLEVEFIADFMEKAAMNILRTLAHVLFGR